MVTATLAAQGAAIRKQSEELDELRASHSQIITLLQSLVAQSGVSRDSATPSTSTVVSGDTAVVGGAPRAA